MIPDRSRSDARSATKSFTGGEPLAIAKYLGRQPRRPPPPRRPMKSAYHIKVTTPYAERIGASLPPSSHKIHSRISPPESTPTVPVEREYYFAMLKQKYCYRPSGRVVVLCHC